MNKIVKYIYNQVFAIFNINKIFVWIFVKCTAVQYSMYRYNVELSVQYLCRITCSCHDTRCLGSFSQQQCPIFPQVCLNAQTDIMWPLFTRPNLSKTFGMRAGFFLFLLFVICAFGFHHLFIQHHFSLSLKY